jgi:hypothetical protein
MIPNFAHFLVTFKMGMKHRVEGQTRTQRQVKKKGFCSNFALLMQKVGGTIISSRYHEVYLFQLFGWNSHLQWFTPSLSKKLMSSFSQSYKHKSSQKHGDICEKNILFWLLSWGHFGFPAGTKCLDKTWQWGGSMRL